MKKQLFALSLLFFILFGISCTKEESKEDETQNEYLVSSAIKFLFSEQILENFINYPGANEIITNGIITYKIVYNTQFEGNNILASGTLTLPDSNGDYPLVLVQRGTILQNSSAPSESKIPYYESLAGMGFVVFVPDLIGYGSSNEYLHPYLDYPNTAQASLDMYYAVQEYMEKDISGVVLDDNFFITGYSQGGYSSMASYKYISENVDDIEVIAVGAGAGGYDQMALVDNILSEETYPNIILLVMPIVSINELYTQEAMESIFNSPYKELVQEVIDGKKDWGDISDQLSSTIKDVFNAELIDKLVAGEETFLTPYLKSNSVHDWAPTKTTSFYHHKLDEIIPYVTTSSTISHMENKGATSLNFIEITDEMIPDPISTYHGDAAIPSLILSMIEFSTY